MQVTQEKVTPATAKKWLETLNTKNRRLRPHKVTQYADQIERGQWIATGDTIKFDTDGHLIDGQHRLAGVVQAGKPVVFTVARGVTTKAFPVLDSGMGRTPGDGLGREVSAAGHKAAAIRLILVYLAGFDPRKTDAKNLVSKIDIAEFYQQNQQAIDDSYLVGNRFYQAFAGGNRSAWLAFIYFAQQASPTHIEEFLTGVLTGENLTRGDVRLALRNWLGNGRSFPTAGHHFGLLVKSWNAWMRGDNYKSIMFRDTEDFPQLSNRRTATVKPRQTTAK